MSRRLAVFPGLAVVASAALLLAGCAGPGAEKLDPAKSPLTEYLVALNSGYDEESVIKQMNETEELIAACMAAEGFDYIPSDQSKNVSFGSEDDVDRDTEEWVASHGYGFTQTPEEIEKQMQESQEFTDPNQGYIESLSESEQAAYYATLHGNPPTEEELGEDGSYEYNWENGGCYGSAQHELQGDSPYDDEAHQPLFDAFSTLYESIAKQPEMVELNTKWAACMADSGYSSLKSKDEAIQTVIEQSNSLYESGEEPSKAKLEEVRQFEIDTALADFKCAEKTGYTHAALKIQFDLERQFITDHKAELDALIADSEKGK